MPYRGISVLLLLLVVAPCIRALGVLLPLYVYPSMNCAAWAPVSAAISTHPTAQFYIIVNPDNGPGSPDATYQSCVAALPSSTNQIVLGYVDTTAGNVLGYIDTYSGWGSTSRPNGIYFDGVSASAGALSITQGYVSHAKSKGFTFMALGPGQTADSSYFSIADLINTYEDSYSSFSAASLSGTLSKQSVTLVNAPSTGSYSAVLSQLDSAGVAAVYITNVPDSSSDLPAQLSEFVSEVAGGSSSGSASSGSTGGSSDSGTTSSGSPSSGTPPSGPESSPSDSSNPDSSASSGSSSKAGSSSSLPKPPSPSLSGHSSQSSAFGGSIATSSGQPLPSSPSSGVQPNQAASGHKKSPPIATIVGAVLGTLVLLLAILSAFMCMRRRRSAGSLESAVAPFNLENVALDMRMAPSTVAVEYNSRSLSMHDVKVPAPATEGVVTQANAGLHEESPSQSWRESTGPPPSYSDN